MSAVHGAPVDQRVVLSAKQLTKIYPAPGGGTVHALADVDVSVLRGRTLGLVGESGSGKTTLTRMLLALEKPTSGTVSVDGQSIADLGADDMRAYRRRVAAVFQNPYSSLDPRMHIWDIVTEQQAIDRTANKRERRARAEELLDLVGIRSELAARYPHELSGGQRQRIAIARAISQDPDVIILDEPLSALDVSVSAQIVNLLLDLQERIGVTYVFVGHDLRLVRHLCHDVAVMYRGRIVEQGPADEVLDAPTHHYTDALAEASALRALAPVDDADTAPTLLGAGAGCAYRNRCPAADGQCGAEDPPAVVIGARSVRCFHPLDPTRSTNVFSTDNVRSTNV